MLIIFEPNLTIRSIVMESVPDPLTPESLISVTGPYPLDTPAWVKRRCDGGQGGWPMFDQCRLALTNHPLEQSFAKSVLSYIGNIQPTNNAQVIRGAGLAHAVPYNPH